MRPYILIITLYLLFGLKVHAQNMVVQTQSEYTVSGIQHGASLQYETASQWGLGVFYQTEVMIREEAYDPGSTFLGVLVQAPLAKTQRLSFFALLRTGLVNNRFVAVVPGLETRLHISPRFGTAFGMGIRMGYASLSGKLFVKIF